MDSASGPNSEMAAELDLASKEVVDDVTGYERVCGTPSWSPSRRSYIGAMC